MIRARRNPAVVAAAFAVGLLLGGAACVDLFHGTDFPTLCADDAAACAEASSAFDAGPTDADSPVDFCSNSSAAARKLAEHTCGWLGACLGPVEQSSFGTCMIRALAAYDCSLNPSLRPRGENAQLWRCLSEVETCDEVASCVFGTEAQSCEAVPSGSTTFTGCSLVADAPVLVECGSSKTAIGMDPCALRGRICAKVDDGKSICAGGRGADCTVSPQCDDTFAVACKAAGGINADEGTNCAALGDGRCVADDAGVACAPPADAGACETTSGLACSDGGASVQSCVGGRLVTMNCAAIDQGCSADGVSPVDPVAACQSLDGGTSCTATDSCSSGVLRSCAQGKTFELPCSNVGLGTCSTSPGGRAVCGKP